MDKPILIKDLGMLFPTEKSKKKARYGLYKCFCGNEFKSNTNGINVGDIKSCGCFKLKRLQTHKLTKHKLYTHWSNMMARCNNIKSNDYKYYGARGIKVCDRWQNIENFISDMYPTFSDGLTIDRIDVNKDYCIENCRWTSRTIQSRNTRKLYANNTSGYRGVCFYKLTNRWVAKIVVNSKKKSIGYFSTAELAARAYDKYVIDNNLEHTRNFN